MGTLHKEEYAELLGQEQGLDLHLRANFYPPHPEYVIRDIKNAFTEHWNGELDCHTELAERCYLRNTDALYRYFDTFLNESDEF